MFKFYTIVLLILLVAAALRFYNLPENFVFAGDEEHQAILAQSIIRHFHIIWIGVNAAHLGFYLGPYWAYFTAFWLMLSGSNPLITGYVASSIGILTTLVIILVGSSIFNKRAGILAGLLYGTLPLTVFFDQKYWNPTLTPLLSVIMLFSLCKLQDHPKLAILFAASFGLIFHTHLSLFPIIFVAIFWIIKEKIKLSKKIIFLSLLTFLLMLAPLLVFDYFHKGTNIMTPLRFKELSSDPVNKVNPAHHFQSLFQTLGRIWYIKPVSVNADEIVTSCAASSRVNSPPQVALVSQRFNPPLVLSLLGFCILLVFFIHKSTWRNKNTGLLALILLAILFSFLFFPGGAYEYYLLGIFSLTAFLPGILTDYFKTFKNIILLAVLLATLLGTLTILTNNSQFGFSTKRRLIQQVISYLDNQPFELKQTGICHFYEGWRYLFVWQDKRPERADSDQGLGWLYQNEITNKAAKYTVMLSESRVLVKFDTGNAKIIQEGGFTAYVFQNF